MSHRFQEGSPHKLDKSNRSLERYDRISRAAKLVGSARVHHQGEPINQQTKAGFNRRPEVRGDASPVGSGSRCEDGTTSFSGLEFFSPAASLTAPLLWSLLIGVGRLPTSCVKLLPVIASVIFPPRDASELLGVVQLLASFPNSPSPCP